MKPMISKVPRGRKGTGRGFVGLALAMAILEWPAQGAEVLRGPIRGGFSVAEADAETGARKYALWGESATPLGGEEWEIQSPRLELYGVGGVTNLVFMASRCFFNGKSEQITSSEALRMWTGDGYLRMQGEGFLLELGVRRLWVSNRVEAVMSKSLFEREDALSVGRRRTESVEGEADEMLIRSDRLEYGSDRAEFQDHVRVEDADGRLDCERLVVNLAPDSRDVQALRAEGEVRFTAGEIEVESSEALYHPTTGRLELTGDPRWVFRQRPGRAQEVVLDRDRRALSAVGEVRMELPASSFVLPAGLGGEAVGLGKADGGEPVRLAADRLDVQPQPGETDRHRVILLGGVLVEQKEGRLRCHELLVLTKGSEHALDRVEATGGVVIERGLERMSCQRAEYDGAGALAEFSGGVEWQTEGESGAAERVWLDLAEKRYRAEGGVRMRFEQVDESWMVGLVPAGGKEGVGDDRGGEAVVARPPTDIVSDRFEYRGARVAETVQFAEYEGNVMVQQGDQFHLACDSLRARLGPETNQVQSVVAEGKVEFRAADGSGYRLARGDRAVYSADEQEVVLTGREGVEFFVIGPSGVSRGVGRQAIYRGAADSLILAGDPTITTPEGELVGREVRLDRRQGLISATGPWQIRLPVGGLELPRLPNP
jgi:lipopolysaccharide export system protein LptA